LRPSEKELPERRSGASHHKNTVVYNRVNIANQSNISEIAIVTFSSFEWRANTSSPWMSANTDHPKKGIKILVLDWRKQ
jgi:hypothetical protein